MSGPSNPDAKEIPSENFSVIEKKIEQSKILKLQKNKNFDFFESWRISKILIFEKISVLFGAFFHDPWGREAQWEFLPSRRRQAQARIRWHLTWLNSFLGVDFREANRTRVD